MNAKGPARGKRIKNVMVHRKEQNLLDSAGCAQSRRLRYRGIALIWSALLMIVMIGLVGLSIDWGKLAVNVHQMQNAADAAALAGAQVVKDQPAPVTRQWAHDIGFANSAEHLAVSLSMEAQDEPFITDANLDIILGRWINHRRTFFPTLDTPDAVRVIARREDGLADAPPLAMLFGPAFGVNTVDAHREAIGWANHVGGAGLIVLDTEPNDTTKPGFTKRPGLKIADNTGDIEVINGTIHVNARWRDEKDDAAVYVKGGGKMMCGRLTLTGYTDPLSSSTEWDRIWVNDLGVQMPYDIAEDSPYLPDPLRDIIPPPIPTNPDGSYKVADPNRINSTCTLNPGYYPAGIDLTASGTEVTLNPGTYWLGGGNAAYAKSDGLYLNGGILIGHGVLIYLTKDYTHADGKWAQLDIRGESVVDITPPGDYMSPRETDGLPGISIWQDRSNFNTSWLGGGGDMNISGTLYFPKNHIYLAGNPGKAGNQILCGSLEVFGRASVIVEYDGRNNLYRRRAILVR